MSNRRIWSAADKRAIVAEAEEPGATVSMLTRRRNAAHRRLLVVADVRNAIPKPQPLATAEFPTLRMRLIKIAERIIDTATRVRIAFAADCPEAELFSGVALDHALNGRSTQDHSSKRFDK
jgi:hypothetical protein